MIIDLEDAVAPDKTSSGRTKLNEGLNSAHAMATPVLVRINGIGTPWHLDDLTAVPCLLNAGKLAGIVLPKTESAQYIKTIQTAFDPATVIIALIETAAGLVLAEGIASAAGFDLKAKLLIHSAQIPPARRGLAPTQAEVAWAERTLAGSGDGGAVSFFGQMVDAPAIARGRQIRKDQDRQSNRRTR